MLVRKYETKETQSMVHSFGAVYNFRSLLHDYAIDPWATVHLCSNFSGQVQNRGNWWKRVAFSWLSSACGRAGNSFHPLGVQRFNIPSPKKASLANFTARRVILHSVLSSLYFCETSGTLNCVLSISEEASSWNFGFTPPIGDGSSTSNDGLSRAVGGRFRAGGDSISDPWNTSEGWVSWGWTGRNGHLGCTPCSVGGGMCPEAGVSSACRPQSWMWSLSSFDRHSISFSILSTACGIRFMSFNISSSFVVRCDAKSKTQLHQELFQWAHLVWPFSSSFALAPRLCQWWINGVISVSSCRSPHVSGMSSSPTRKSSSSSSITFLGPVSAWLEDGCNCALYNWIEVCCGPCC